MAESWVKHPPTWLTYGTLMDGIKISHLLATQTAILPTTYSTVQYRWMIVIVPWFGSFGCR
jgi:hypothetical protein